MQNGRWTCPNVANTIQNGRWTCPHVVNPMQNGRWTCQNVANTIQNGRWTCPHVVNPMQNGRWTCPNVANTMQNDKFQFQTVANTRQMVPAKKSKKNSQTCSKKKSQNYFTPFLNAMAFCTELWMFAILVLSVLGQIKHIEPLTMMETRLVLWISTAMYGYLLWLFFKKVNVCQPRSYSDNVSWRWFTMPTDIKSIYIYIFTCHILIYIYVLLTVYIYA